MREGGKGTGGALWASGTAFCIRVLDDNDLHGQIRLGRSMCGWVVKKVVAGCRQTAESQTNGN